jgi:hypothetical protein
MLHPVGLGVWFVVIARRITELLFKKAVKCDMYRLFLDSSFWS